MAPQQHEPLADRLPPLPVHDVEHFAPGPDLRPGEVDRAVPSVAMNGSPPNPRLAQIDVALSGAGDLLGRLGWQSEQIMSTLRGVRGRLSAEGPETFPPVAANPRSPHAQVAATVSVIKSLLTASGQLHDLTLVSGDLTTLVQNGLTNVSRRRLAETPLVAEELALLRSLHEMHKTVVDDGPESWRRLVLPLLTESQSSDLECWQQTFVPMDTVRPRAAGNGPIGVEVRDIRQYRPNACGDACLQALLGYHGRSNETFGTNSRLPFLGLSPIALRQQLADRGIASVNLQPDERRRASSMQIRQWLVQYGPLLAVSAHHYVLITGIEGETVRIHCPLLGARRGSMDRLNRFVNWSRPPSPFMATYKATNDVTMFDAQRKPGLFSRLIAKQLVGSVVSTRGWEPAR
ncbi:MAG: papain-like cysteine protease family protein [Gammaproteobacteria bacterium]